MKGRQSSPEWLKSLQKFARADTKRAVLQLFDTLGPYLLLWAVMIWMLERGSPYIYVLLLSVPAALFLVRTFIIFHDCTHNSFFPSTVANRITGTILGIITFTPYEEWRSSHMEHHQAVGNLDRRGVGDVMTLTVKEYREASWKERFFYRVYRNPFVLLLIGPVYTFVIRNRWSHKGARRREVVSVIVNNIGIAIMILAMGFAFGFKTYIAIQAPVLFIAGVLGIWLFYVQHQFEDVYWMRQDQWNMVDAAMKGSSFYRLPGILQWFAGNIGFHHIHHLRPTIPNYNLQACFREVPEVRKVKPITLPGSFKSLFMNLYDEDRKRMISFRDLKSYKSNAPGV